MKKSWRARLADDREEPRIKPIPQRMRKKSGDGTIVIPTFREVDQEIRKIRKGKVATVQLLSESLARKHRTTIACAVTTGIYAWWVANVAHEAERDGDKKIAPYWRVLKSGGELNPKYPGGISRLRARLQSEGHSIVRGRANYQVENFEARLAKL